MQHTRLSRSVAVVSAVVMFFAFNSSPQYQFGVYSCMPTQVYSTYKSRFSFYYDSIPPCVYHQDESRYYIGGRFYMTYFRPGISCYATASVCVNMQAAGRSSRVYRFAPCPESTKIAMLYASDSFSAGYITLSYDTCSSSSSKTTIRSAAFVDTVVIPTLAYTTTTNALDPSRQFVTVRWADYFRAAYVKIQIGTDSSLTNFELENTITPYPGCCNWAFFPYDTILKFSRYLDRTYYIRASTSYSPNVFGSPLVIQVLHTAISRRRLPPNRLSPISANSVLYDILGRRARPFYSGVLIVGGAMNVKIP